VTGRPDDDRIRELEDRVARMESALGEIQKRVGGYPGDALDYRDESDAVDGDIGATGASIRDGGYWLRMVGVALLLFGVAFLFKYSENESRQIHALRMGIAILIGAAMIFTGARLHHRERGFARVLLGGGIAVWYIASFAAYQVFHLIPVVAAFLVMTLVTGFAMATGVRYRAVAISVLATLGGLGTPFVLETEAGRQMGTMMYICLVSAGTVLVYVRMGWTALLWVGFWGTWLAVMGGLMKLGVEPSAGDRWAVQAGLIFAWAVFWLVPLRGSLRTPVSEPLPPGTRRAGDPAQVTSLLSPFLLMIGVEMLWHLSQRPLGVSTLAVAAVCGLFAWRLRGSEKGDSLFRPHLIPALLLGTAGIALLFRGNTLALSYAVFATGIIFAASRDRSRLLMVWGHVLFAIVAYGELTRLTGSRTQPALISVLAITDLICLGSFVLASRYIENSRARRVYRHTAYAGLLLWLMRELSAMPNGQGVATLSWALCAAVLITLGLRRGSRSLERLGLATLFFTAAKLFAVDLSSVPAIWRIVLFLGFGGGFLGLSYYLRMRHRAPEPDGASIDSAD
jgi:uncharacterized membrane protein